MKIGIVWVSKLSKIMQMPYLHITKEKCTTKARILLCFHYVCICKLVFSTPNKVIFVIWYVSLSVRCLGAQIFSIVWRLGTSKPYFLSAYHPARSSELPCPPGPPGPPFQSFEVVAKLAVMFDQQVGVFISQSIILQFSKILTQCCAQQPAPLVQ